MLLFGSLLLLQYVIAAETEQNEKSELPEKFRPLKSYLLGLEEKRKAQLDFVLKAAKNVNSGKMATMAFETVTQVDFSFLLISRTSKTNFLVYSHIGKISFLTLK